MPVWTDARRDAVVMMIFWLMDGKHALHPKTV